MFAFEQFWEYTNQRIRYNEGIKERTNLTLSDLKKYPPVQYELPVSPKLRPKLLRQGESRNVLRRSHLRLNKTKHLNYVQSLEQWAHKKYEKLTEKEEYETDSDEWETDSDYDEIQETPLMPIKDPTMDPVQRQQRMLQEAEEHPSKPDVLAINQHVVSNLVKGPLPTMKRIAPSGKRLRKKKKTKRSKKKKAWEGDENKRLNICVGALMMIRLDNQLAIGGLLSSITLYMRTHLGMSAPSAAVAISVWQGVCYLTPLISAYYADAKWGRAQTLLIAQYIFFCGMACIAISTYFGVNYYFVTNALFWTGMAVVAVGFGGFKPVLPTDVLNLTVSPLGADQFDAKHKTDEQKKIAKEKRSSFFGWLYWANQLGGIIAASVIAYVCQNIDFTIGWSIAAVALIFAIASYYGAKNYFIMVPPEGSVFGDFFKVSCISCHAKCRGQEPPSPLPIPYTPTGSQRVSPAKLCSSQSIPLRASQKGLDDVDEQQTVPLKSAASAPYPNYHSLQSVHDRPNDLDPMDNLEEPPSTPPASGPLQLTLQQSSQYYSPGKPSMLDINKRSNGGAFEDTFVEDIKSALSALPALIPFPVAYIIYTNLLTLVYSQGCQMNVHMGSNGFIFPISSLSIITTVTIIVFVPLTDQVVYPAMNRYGGCLKVTPLRKMGVAFTLAIIAMLISGITEIVRKSQLIRQFTLEEMQSPCGDGLPVSDISILWQSPQFFLLGMSRVLINTGAQDFFYTESPKSMKSTLFSVLYAVDGIGMFMGSLSIMVVNAGDSPWITNDLNDGHLEYYFFLIGGIMMVLFGMFLVFADGYTYKEFKRKRRGQRLRGK